MTKAAHPWKPCQQPGNQDEHDIISMRYVHNLVRMAWQTYFCWKGHSDEVYSLHINDNDLKKNTTDLPKVVARDKHVPRSWHAELWHLHLQTLSIRRERSSADQIICPRGRGKCNVLLRQKRPGVIMGWGDIINGWECMYLLILILTLLAGYKCWRRKTNWVSPVWHYSTTQSCPINVCGTTET